MQDREPQIRVQIGAEIKKDPQNVRVLCPKCGAIGPRALTVGDFEEASRELVRQAIADGNDFYACTKCETRYAVRRQQVRRHDGTIEFAPKPTPKRGFGRHARRAQQAIAKAAETARRLKEKKRR